MTLRAASNQADASFSGFDPDSPIKTPEEDLLGRTEFAKRVARSIRSLDNKDSFVIGIEGPWGCGKSSLANMVREEILETNSEDNRIAIVDFNPWNEVEPDNYVRSFFRAVRKGFETSLRGSGERTGSLPARAKGLVSTAVSEISDHLDSYISYFIPQPDPTVLLAFKGLKLVKNSLDASRANRQNDIFTSKMALSKQLEKSKARVLVVIDDIDRLNNEQIRTVFQIVSTIANFPSLNYLLIFDREVVINALSGVQGVSGELYLEKIIQIQFFVPEVEDYRIANLLHGELLKLVQNHSPKTREGVLADFKDGEAFPNERYRLREFVNIIRPSILTLRRLKQLINAASFCLAGRYGEADPVDLVEMCYLQIFHRKAMEWIALNKNLICACGKESDRVLVWNMSEENIAKLLSSSEKPSAADHIAAQIIKHVFLNPRNQAFDRDIRVAEFHLYRRLADIGQLNSFLTGTIADSSLLEDQIKERLDPLKSDQATYPAFNEAEFPNIYQTIVGLERTLNATEQCNALRLLLDSLRFTDRTPTSISSEDVAGTIVDIAGILGIEKASSTIGDAYHDLNSISIVRSSELIIGQMRKYHHHGLSGDNYLPAIVDEDTLTTIERKFCAMMRNLVKNSSLYSLPHLQTPVLLWKHSDRDGFNTALSTIPEHPEAVVLVAWSNLSELHSLVNDTGSDKQPISRWIVNQPDERLSKLPITQSILKLTKSNILFTLPDETQLRIATLYLGFTEKSFGIDGGGYRIAQAQSQLASWRREVHSI